ncbi:hypothetical protein GDO78_011523 [Eleutherodactylus coqui]|uniref:Uncharacterized protein n=1 Tax=Eleutherodactylus coqui TaxID=57060 RepID=A0A8J6K8L7_ELECQ|nr:hypothetical protein GDO78_011523 [Eleutherodactylus coqui]
MYIHCQSIHNKETTRNSRMLELCLSSCSNTVNGDAAGTWNRCCPHFWTCQGSLFSISGESYQFGSHQYAIYSLLRS